MGYLAEWRYWGKKDPLWAAITIPGREKGSEKEWTADEFYKLGEDDWNFLRDRWTAYGLTGSSCLELGCGPGRITKWLPDHFRSVVAVDISPEMIAAARRAVSHGSVEWKVGDGASIPAETGAAGHVFSLYVLQHLDRPEEVFRCFEEIFRVMRSGGTLMVQIPVVRLPRNIAGKVAHAVLRCSKAAGNVRAAWLRTRLRNGAGGGLMRGLYLDEDTLLSRLEAIGFRNCEVHTFRIPSGRVPVTFVLAAR